MKHPVSGEIKELTENHFLAMFDESVRPLICERAQREGTHAMVCFECLQMDSPFYGKRTAVCVGPQCSISLEDIEGGAKIGDLPSTFQYPVSLWRTEDQSTKEVKS